MHMDLKRIDVLQVLRSLKVEFDLRGEEAFCLCPNSEHGDKNIGSFLIRVGGQRNGLARCYACGWKGNLVSFVADKKQIKRGEAISFLKGMRKRILDDGLNRKIGLGDYKPQRINPPDGLLDVGYGTTAYRYLMTNGIRQVDIERFGLKDWRKRARIWIPTYYENKLISWVARTYKDEYPKVKTPSGSSQKWTLFGYDFLEWDINWINLCEGWKDAIRLYQAGFKNPVAACGSDWNKEKTMLVGDFDRVIVWQDGDKAGRKFVRKIRSFLREQELLVVPFEEHDPGYFGPDEIREMKPITFERWREWLRSQ